MDKQNNNWKNSYKTFRKVFKRMFNPENPKDLSNMIEKMILNGSLEVAGIDEKTGELLYNLTPKAKELMPAFYEEHINTVNGQIMNLWQKGYLNLELFDKDPKITITQKALDLEKISQLSQEEQWSLEEVKRLLKLKNSK